MNIIQYPNTTDISHKTPPPAAVNKILTYLSVSILNMTFPTPRAWNRNKITLELVVQIFLVISTSVPHTLSCFSTANLFLRDNSACEIALTTQKWSMTWAGALTPPQCGRRWLYHILPHNHNTSLTLGVPLSEWQCPAFQPQHKDLFLWTGYDVGWGSSVWWQYSSIDDNFITLFPSQRAYSRCSSNRKTH